MLLGIQDAVGDAPLFEEGGQILALFDADRAHEDGLALGMALLDLADDGAVFPGLVLIDRVRPVHAGDGLVRGDLHDVEVVDGHELLFLGKRCAGHAGELPVQAEVVLEGDGGEGLVLPLDLHMLLGLDGLVQALGVPAAQHQAAGVLVHDDDLVVLHHIVDVPAHDAVGLDGLVDVVGEGGVLEIRQILDAEVPLGLLDAPGGEARGAGLLVHEVIGVFVRLLELRLLLHGDDHAPAQAGDKVVRAGVEVRALVPLAGDDEGGPGLVDEDGVHLVHDGEEVPPLDHVPLIEGHIVPEVVEAHLVVGAVGDVGVIGRLPLLPRQAVDDEAHGEAEEGVDLAHPLAVAPGQVVVHRDDVDALALEGV